MHHLHAHQWLHTPNDDQGSYRDSQMISPGGSCIARSHVHRQRQQEQDGRRRDLPLPLLSAFAPGDVGVVARPRRVRRWHCAQPQQQRPITEFNRRLPDGENRGGHRRSALVPIPTSDCARWARASDATVPVDVIRLADQPARVPRRSRLADPHRQRPGFHVLHPGRRGAARAAPAAGFRARRDRRRRIRS